MSGLISHLVKEGDLLKVCNGGPRRYKFVLFSDMLVYGTETMRAKIQRDHRKYKVLQFLRLPRNVSMYPTPLACKNITSKVYSQGPRYGAPVLDPGRALCSLVLSVLPVLLKITSPCVTRGPDGFRMSPTPLRSRCTGESRCTSVWYSITAAATPSWWPSLAESRLWPWPSLQRKSRRDVDPEPNKLCFAPLRTCRRAFNGRDLFVKIPSVFAHTRGLG